MKWLLRSLYIIAGAIALLIGGYALWSAWATSQLDRRLTALREQGMPVTLADLEKDVPPPEENAAVWLRRGREGFEALDKEAATIQVQHPMPADDLRRLREALATYRPAVDCARAAARATNYHAEPDYHMRTAEFIAEQLKRIQLVRSAERALNYTSIVELSDGDIEGSLRTAQEMLDLSKHLSEEPSIIAYLVRLAVVGMAVARFHDLLAAPLDEEIHVKIEQALSAVDLDAAFKRALETERALSMDAMDELHTYSGILPIPPAMKMQMCGLIDLLGTAHGLTEASYVEARQQLDQPVPYSAFAKLSGPALLASFNAHARVSASIRTLRILNAIRAQKVNDAQDLKIEEAVWKDPFNGERLRIKVTDDMWTVYSVGRNLRDDGGEVDHRKDADTGWRMPR